MRRSHLSLIGFAACAVAGYWIATAQAPPVDEPKQFGPVPAVQTRLWPPRAQDMVSFYRRTTASEETLCAVPDDRWLVLVGIDSCSPDVNATMKLIERSDSTDTARYEVRALGDYGPSLPVGLAFPPGSEVVVQLTGGTWSYLISGYLTDQ